MGDLSQNIFAIGRIDPQGITLLGTCFAVSPNKVATAFHVVGHDDARLALILPRVDSLADYQDTSDVSVNMINLSMCAADPVRDLCVLQMAPGNSVTFSYAIGSSDDVPPGSVVTTFGFPHANLGRMVLTQQTAHVGARILVQNEMLKTKHIVLNAQAREGQSGGPVFTAGPQLRVVAVLIGSYAPTGGGRVIIGGIDPATLHQTTHAISAEYLRAML